MLLRASVGTVVKVWRNHWHWILNTLYKFAVSSLWGDQGLAPQTRVYKLQGCHNQANSTLRYFPRSEGKVSEFLIILSSQVSEKSGNFINLATRFTKELPCWQRFCHFQKKIERIDISPWHSGFIAKGLVCGGRWKFVVREKWGNIFKAILTWDNIFNINN